VTLGLTWVVSIAVSSPIALGANYTERRAQTPWLCTFYNSNFLIGSSMTSFYVPCILMIILYWRTFRAINARACKMAAMTSGASRKSTVHVALTGSGSVAARAVVVDSEDTIYLSAMPTEAKNSSEKDGERHNTAAALVQYGAGESVSITTSGCKDYNTFHVVGTTANASTSDDSQRPMSPSVSVNGLNPTNDSDDAGEMPVAAFIPVSNSRPDTLVGRNGNSLRHPGTQQQLQQRQRQRRRRRLRLTTMTIQPTSATASTVDSGERTRRTNGDPEKRDRCGGDVGCDDVALSGTTPARCGRQQDGGGDIDRRVRRRSAMFGFNLQRFNVTSQRHESKLSTKRERKATKTLAIVLG